MDNSDKPGPSRKMPGGAWKPSHDTPTDSQLLPLLSELPKLRSKGLLIVFIPVAIGVVLLGVTNLFYFEWILGALFYSACMYFVYRICGKSKPAWLLIGSGIFTIGTLNIYVMIHGQAVDHLVNDVLPQAGILQKFFLLLFQVAIYEELVKSLPILIGVFLGYRLLSPRRELLGVLEPLDGLLIGAASATGFAFWETLTNYAGPDVSGLANLIVRSLLGLSAHVAYTGCLGYYLGLAVLKPAKRWQEIGIGVGMAVFLHAVWDTVAAPVTIFTLIVALLSLCVLTTAILKARQISPTRRDNWATTVSASSITVPPQQAQPLPLPNPQSPMAGAVPPPIAVAVGPLVLRVGAARVPLTAGRTLTEQELPGLAPLTGQMVAEVSANPRNPEILGLKNQSVGVWSIRDPERGILKINPGQTFRVLPGTRVNFGSMFGEVEQG